MSNDNDTPKTIDATNIHAAMIAAKVQIDHHETDLYVPVTVETSGILARYTLFSNVTTFWSELDNALWFDIPFVYLSNLEVK